jgi:D-alanine-D-alanine ligase
LQTGATILQTLREHYLPNYEAVYVLITKDGTWHIGGKSITAAELKDRVDVVFNALHGEYGEDGQIQTLLEELGIPYTGSGPVASAIGMNKKLTKDTAKTLGIKTPNHYTIPDYRFQHGTVEEVYFKEQAQNVFLKFSPPWVIKPTGASSPVGVSIALTREQLLEGIKDASRFPGDIMIEEFIKGKEASVVVTDHFRNQPVYSFLPVEIRMHNKKVQEVSPGNFTAHEKHILEQLAKNVYKGLGLRHYARIDFIVTPKRTYLLQVSTLPEMSSESLVAKSLLPLGSNLPEFLDHVIKLALGK